MLQNPSNLFSGGQGLLRSPRITDFVAQREAKKRAREEALNDYFIKLPSTINAAGVRQQDLMNPKTGQGILSKINDWTQRGMQNLDQIKANPQAYSQHMAELNQIKNDIAYSKGLGKSQLEFNKERAEKGWDFDDNDIQTLSKMEQSMYDKEHYREDGLPYGFGDLSGAISAYTPQMGNQTDKLVTGDFKPEYDPASRAVRLDPTGKVIVTKAYSPKAIQNMGERMEAIASTNKSVNRHYSKMMDNPEQIEKATVALQKVYGQFDADGNEIIADTPEKLAKGLTIADKTNFKKDELVRDEALAQQYKKEMVDYQLKAALKKMKYSDKLIQGRMDKANKLKKLYYDYTQSGGANDTEGIVTKYINLLKDGAEPYKYVTINGQKFGEGKFISPSVTVADKLSVSRDTEDGKFTETVKPDAIYLTNDGKTAIPVRFQRDKEGKVLKSPTGATRLDNRGFNPIPVPNLRVEISKDIIAKKNQGEEVIDEFTVDDPEVRESFKEIESGSESSSERKPVKETKPQSLAERMKAAKGKN